MSFTLHLFPSSEDWFDVCGGCDSLYQHTFPSEEMAMLWYESEFSDLIPSWCLASDEQLATARAERTAS